MKVLQICAYAARYGGNFIASLQMLEELLQLQNMETEYLFPETARDMPWCQALQKRAVVHFAGLNRFSPKTYRQIAAAMERADIVHSHFELYDCLTALAKKKYQKLFWHLHDSFDEEIDFAHRAVNKVQYGILGKRAVLISPSTYYADYVKKLGFPGQKIHIVDNCVHFDRLHKQEAAKKQWDFLIFGGFYRIKGLDVLLEGCRILIEKGYQFRVGIVGYPETWTFIREHYSDVLPVVSLLEPQEDVSCFYNGAKTFICASRRECFSYALLEALYMKLPAIISDIPGNRWAVDFTSTLSFASGDAIAIADAMEKRLTGAFRPDTEETAKSVEQRYASQIWAEKVKEIYTGG